MLSLLLTLVVIGLVAYFALRGLGGGGSTSAGGNQQTMVNCERLASELIGRTGGIGPDYKAGYDAAPPSCRRMLPAPAGITPTVPESQGE
jgi:hypothetical protein